MIAVRGLLASTLLLSALTLVAPAGAQQLDMPFSCSATRDDHGLPTRYADHGMIKIDGAKIEEFYWESSLFRDMHGLECSINQDDGVQAEVIVDGVHDAWRIMLQDAHEARDRRGYDLTHGFNCTIRVDRVGESVHLRPSCPAMCGSRENFSELTVDVKTGTCHYED
jgi:hypothetical protein